MLTSLSSQSLRLFSTRPKIDALISKCLSERQDGLLAEHEVWSIIGDLGFSISEHKYVSPLDDPAEIAHSIKADRLVAKGVIRMRKDNSLVTHKTDIGAIAFNIPRTTDGIASTMKTFSERFNSSSPYKLEGILFVEMMKIPSDFGTEMLISGYQDPFFGPTVCYGLGGTLVEYLKEVMLPGHASIFMPALFNDRAVYERALKTLPVAQLAEGKIRGTKNHMDHDRLIETLGNLQDVLSEYSIYNRSGKYVIDELEVNPTTPIGGKLWALDGVMRVSKRDPLAYLSPLSSGKPLDNINCLMKPESIIVAGASSKSLSNPGSAILGKAVEAGLNDIYAIHPKESKLLGHPAFKTLKEIKNLRNGKPVDLLSVCIPAKSAGKMLSEALDLHCAKAIQVVAGGFGETEHGAKMQDELHEKLFNMPKGDRPVVNGPNTVGNYCGDGINTIFVDSTRSNSDMKSGKHNCALICQSGAFMVSRISDIAPAVMPHIAISVGNQLDLSVTDFFEHYIYDPKITTYGMYCEGLSDGEGIRLMNLVQRAKSLGKTVIIYKAGRTQAGIRAAKGHTAAMAGDFKMFKSLLEFSGAIVVDTFEDWNQLLILSTLFPSITKNARGKSTGVGVVTNAGFEKCACADHLMVNGMDGIMHLPKWTKETLTKFDAIYKKGRISEVVDVSEVLDVTPQFTDSGYIELTRAILQDPGCDVAFISAVPETQTVKALEADLSDPTGIFQGVKKLVAEFPNKPIIAVFESGERYQPIRRELNRIGVACFSSIDAASRSLVQLVRTANK